MKICFVFLSTLLASTLFAQTSPYIGDCAVFPPNNVWNTKIDSLPIDPASNFYVNTEGGSATPLHPDFGTVWNGAPNGSLFVIVPPTQPPVPIVFTAYGSESDSGPYPVPPDAPIEGGAASAGDRHVLVLQSSVCKLYELFSAYPKADGSWQAMSGAVFDLKANGPLRPASWTSADAAGLPIVPGLVRYDEVQQAIASGTGVLPHALRFTVVNSRAAFIWPARHYASLSTNPAFAPMGQRFRLKASANIDVYPGTSQAVSAINRVILQTLKTYGMFVADNGGSFFVSGEPDARWDDADLHSIGNYKASDFEAIDESSLMVDPNSAEALQSSAPSISIAPSTSSTISGTVILTANAQSSVGVSSVQFNLDGAIVLGAGTAAANGAFQFTWITTNLPNGNHVLTAIVTDKQGATATSATVAVSVSNFTRGTGPRRHILPGITQFGGREWDR